MLSPRVPPQEPPGVELAYAAAGDCVDWIMVSEVANQVSIDLVDKAYPVAEPNKAVSLDAQWPCFRIARTVVEGGSQ